MTGHRRNVHRREVGENKEEFRFIWLDENINDSVDSLRMQTILLELNPAAQFYTDQERCINLIKSIEYEQILLIISRDFAHLVVPQIGHLRSVVGIFIFCTNPQQYSSLKNEYEETLQILIDEDVLLKSICQTINLLEKQTEVFC
jgi:hypothetical protein